MCAEGELQRAHLVGTFESCSQYSRSISQSGPCSNPPLVYGNSLKPITVAVLASLSIKLSNFWMSLSWNSFVCSAGAEAQPANSSANVSRSWLPAA